MRFKRGITTDSLLLINLAVAVVHGYDYQLNLAADETEGASPNNKQLRHGYTGNMVKVASGGSYRTRLRKTGWSLVPEGDQALRAMFKVNLKQCNIDKLEDLAMAVSDLDSPLYGKQLSSEELCELTSCPGREEGLEKIVSWLGGPSNGEDVSMTVYCSHIVVSMSLTAAKSAFPQANFRAHLPPARGDSGSRRALLRATGDVLIPESIAEHVEFISGLTELWTGSGASHAGYGHGGGGMGKRDGSFAGRAAGMLGASGSMEAGNFTQVLLKPRTLRTLYGVPEGERGGWSDKGKNRQGVAAFNDFFLASDLCSAHNLLAPDADWLNVPDVTYVGPAFDPDADEAESDLDTQYITMMGSGVPVTFANHAEGQWVLDWAQEAAEGDLRPEKGGPLVWSVSYGFPETWQCSVTEGGCDNGIHGYDPTLYLRTANAMLAKLAALRVSVLVASGDDGSPGFGATCPVDPKMPVDMSAGQLEGGSHSCPFPDQDDCKCASFHVETPRENGTASDPPLRCILPLGLTAAVLATGADAVGADCLELLEDPDCEELLLKMENDTTTQDNTPLAFGGSNACHTSFSLQNGSFYSDCACSEVPTVTEGNCTLKGYVYDSARDGPTVFTPDFPASSPWVTSVGATQVAWDLSGSCLQSDLLGPGNAASAETAVNKYTGGFDGGGGFSTFFPLPDYQKDEVQAYCDSTAAPPKGTYNQSNRGYPDVSAAGHNYVVVVGGKVSAIGGTSASAPALAGMISLMNERLLAAGKTPLGFLNPALYKAKADKPEAFQAVIPKTYDLSGTPLEEVVGATYQVGSNRCTRFSCCEVGYWGAEDGSWDPVTGLGTINYEALADYLKIPPGPRRPPARGHDRHHAAYVAWIVVLVFCFATAVVLLVHEHRPKLILSASNLGRSMRRSTGSGGYGSSSYDNDDGARWGDGGGRGGGRRGRPRGALTEMVMESEVGLGIPEAGDLSHRLLDDHVSSGEEGGQEEEDPQRQRV